MRARRISLSIALVASIVAACSGGGDKAAAKPKVTSQFSWLGPTNIAGRVRTVAIDPTDSKVIYAAGASGGIWKSVDRGVSWRPLDDYLPSLTISSLAIDPDDHETIYAGTGEIFTRRHEGVTLRGEDRGAGVLVSHNAGLTWKVAPGTESWRYVSRIAVRPPSPPGVAAQPNVVLAATESGLFRSTTHGDRWDPVAATTGPVVDVKFHPRSPRNAVAGGLDGFALFSTDLGETWSPVDVPATVATASSRLEIAPVNSAGIWRAAALNGTGIQLLTSADNGKAFKFLNAGAKVCAVADRDCDVTVDVNDSILNNNRYTGAIWVDPRDANKMIVAGVELVRTLDGGRHFHVLPNTHDDVHQILANDAFSGAAGDQILVANDGGLARLNNYDGASPSVENLNDGLRAVQFHSAVMNPVSQIVVGTAQDTGVLKGEPDPAGGFKFLKVHGADGATATTDVADGQTFYFALSLGRIMRSTTGGDDEVCIAASSPQPLTDANSNADCGGGGRHCFNVSPIWLDLADAEHDRLYVGCAGLWRTDQAKAAPAAVQWTQIKPADGDHVITSLAQSRSNPEVMWLTTAVRDFSNATPEGCCDVLASPGGKVWRTTHLSRDDGTREWTQLDPNHQLPDAAIVRIVVHPQNPDIAYVAFSTWLPGPHVWRTADGGNSWAAVASGLPSGPVWSLAIHPVRRQVIYAGTDAGLYASRDEGQTWSATTRGPANVPIADLQWVGTTSKLVVATYGRGSSLLDATLTTERVYPEAMTGAAGRVEHLLAGGADDHRVVAVGTGAPGSTSARKATMTLSGRSLMPRPHAALAGAREAPKVLFTLESKQASGTSLSVEFLNVTTGAFQAGGSVTTDSTETERRFAAPGDAVDFVGANGEVVVRLTWVNNSVPLVAGSVDSAFWTIPH